METSKVNRVTKESYSGTGLEENEVFIMKKIKRNRIKCLKCGDIVESKVPCEKGVTWCSCKQCAAAGGTKEIIRYFRTEKPEEAFEEMMEWE